MVGLALRTLRFRKGGFVASFVALFFGAVIVAACGGLMETGIRADARPQRLAAAPVVVTGDQLFDSDAPALRARVPASLTERIAALPGVARALPDVSFPATAQGGGQAVTGHGWSSARIAGAQIAEGTAPRGVGETALDARLADRLGLKTGDRLRLTVAGAAEPVRVTGVARPTAGAAAAVYFTDAEAVRLLGPGGRVNAIAVYPEPGTGTERLRKDLAPVLRGTDAQAVTGDNRSAAEFPGIQDDAAKLVSLSAVFGGIAAMVVVFVVGSTLAVLVQQRMREMALLRAVGALPGQIRRLVVCETLVVGVLATVPALVPGRAAGRLMLERFAGGGVVSPQISYRAGWIPLATAAGAALLAAVAAACIASRRAAVVRPAAALAEAGLQSRWMSAPRLVFALLCFAGGTALAMVTATVMPGSVAASTAGPTAMLWASGIALVCPGLTRVLIAALRPPLRLLPSLACHLASDNVRARRVRTAGAVTAVMLATGLATALLYLQTTQDASARDAALDVNRSGTAPRLTTAVPALAAHGPTGTPTAANAPAGSTATAVPAHDPSAPTGTRGYDSDARTAAPASGTGAGGSTGARENAGDVLRASGVAGRAEHGTAGPAVRLAAGGTSPDAWINFLLAGTIIGYAVISLVNTLVVAASERREEFALQRLVGATTGQVLRMMTVEALLVTVLGTVLGSLVAGATLVPFRLALDGSWLPGGPWWIYLTTVGLVGALTLAATLLPVRLALRSRPTGAPAAR